jgi:hypothetical protein
MAGNPEVKRFLPSDAGRYSAIIPAMNRWDKNEIIESQIEHSPYGLKRLADTFPGLTDEEKELAREDVRENVRPLFVYCSNGLSDRTHGSLSIVERGEVKIFQRTWAKARDIIRLTPPVKSLKVPPKRMSRG